MKLFEIKAAPLYHWLSFAKMKSLFDDDVLKGTWSHKFEGKTIIGSSFTRNRALHWGSYDVRLTLDQAKLSMRHKIMPVDGIQSWGNGKQRDRQGGTQQELAEEFLIGDVKKASEYITEVLCTNTDDIPSGLVEYCERHGINLNMPADYWKKYYRKRRTTLPKSDK